MIRRKKFDITSALQVLRPNSQWVLRGDNFSGLEWRDQEQECPTHEEIETEIQRLQAEYDLLEYQRMRVDEYPTIEDQLDLLFWDKVNDTDNWQTTINNIKNKYPKPL
jgi:hypothetical protein